MANEKIERELFVAFLKSKGIVKIEWNCLGVITNMVREAGCALGYNDVELMQEVWEAKAQAVPTWISVTDQEPLVDTTVLICWSDSPDAQPEMDYMTTDEDLNHIWANFDNDPPSHWMHLHKVPSESGAKE